MGEAGASKIIRSVAVLPILPIFPGCSRGEHLRKKLNFQIIAFLSALVFFSGCGGDSGGGSGDAPVAKGKNANLADLRISSGTLNPLFDANTTAYASQVQNSVSSLRVTPTAADSNSTVTVNGQTVSSGTASQSINLSVDSNTVTILVTAQDGTTTKIYTMNVTRNNGFWNWERGDTTVNQRGVYGSKGVAAATNKPGARYMSISWRDSGGNFWLFGGYGYDSAGNLGYLNDLWKFDGANWTWVSTDSTRNQSGVYGSKGVAAATNKPGSRQGSISWTDSSGNLWLFGGYGYDSAGNLGYLNDLWKFDGANWTWVSADSTMNHGGVYGTRGVAADANKPGGRDYSISWTDSSGNLWLLGGYGYDSAGNLGYLNDLWKFDGTDWTWVTGDSARNQCGVYGTREVAADTNKPGGRYMHISWRDGSGNFWLFGGRGYDSTGTFGYLNDLWKFDGTDWTWEGGDTTMNQIGINGGAAVASTNKPGSRSSSVSWSDSSGNLWLFGGYGYDTAGNLGYLNDLWKVSP